MGEELSKKVIMTFVILSILVIIMFLILIRFKQESWNLYNKEVCKKSVELQAKQKQFLTIKGEHLTDLYGNQVELKCSTEYKTIDDKDNEIIKRKIANSMFNCWDQYGRGKVEIFDTKDRNYCVICSSLEFTKKDEIKDFTKFLIEEKPSPSSDIYINHLMETHVKQGGPANSFMMSYENSKLKNLDKIDLTNPLAVIFYMGKEAYPDAKFLTEASKTKTTIVGTGGGAIVSGTIAGIAIGVGIVECATLIGCIKGLGMIATGITKAGIIGGTAGGTLGYFVGSDSSAEWDARVLTYDYTKLNDLDCTYLEGRATPLRPTEMHKYK